MRFRHLVPAAALLAGLAVTPAAGAATIVPGQVVVRYSPASTHAERVAAEVRTGTGRGIPLLGGTRALKIEDGQSVGRILGELRAQPGVQTAVPNYVLHAAGGFYPNDPGRGGPGDWQRMQWNFAGTFGIHAPQAWATMRALHKDGGRGVVVAVIDSGVAYRDYRRFRRAPDLYRGRFTKGWDFIDHDHYPLDKDGHGTHVTGTIAEHVNNGEALTGLAYGVRIMPIRVLNANGNGNTITFARAVKWAVKHGADVINLSVTFDNDMRAADIPEAIDAIRYANKHGVVMVAAGGNEHSRHLDYPARDHDVIAVGATTADGCRARYSNTGDGLDVSAPGGGADADPVNDPWDLSHCDPGNGAREIFQQTFLGSYTSFHLVGFEGTSAATPHVSAIAALIIASGRLGSHPSPAAVQQRIESTARDLGPPGYDKRYGYGLVDAAAAVGP